MLSVGTYLLALAIAAVPVKGTPRVELSPTPANAECSSREFPECMRETLAEDQQSLLLPTPERENLRSSLYGEGFCDPDDSGECLAPPVGNDRPAPAAILSCSDPYLTTMIGSCDLPREPFLGHTPRVATLRNGAATRVAWVSTAHGGHVVIVSPPPSAEGALIASAGRLQVFIPPASELSVSLPGPALAPPPPRLDRPPRV